MKKLVRKNIQKFKPYEQGKPLEDVRRELGLKKIIKLASNENPLGTSPKAKQAIKKVLDNVNRYPDGNCFYLKKKIAEKLDLKSSNIIIGNGSNEIIELIIKTFLNEDEEVIMSKPDFLIFKLATLQENGIPVEIELKDFRCNLDGIREAINKNTKVIFIANPNNPVGTYITDDELNSFINNIPDDIIVVIDEAYYDFAEGEKNFPDSLQYLDRKNVIILRTFSKSYGLAGLRVGHGIANEETINYINNSRQPFNVNYLAQVAALAALDDDKFLKRTQETTQEGKVYLCRELNKLGIKYVPSATNFVLINVKTNCKKFFRKMLKKGVIIREMTSYGFDTWIRVTIGTRKENEKFINTFKKILKGG